MPIGDAKAQKYVIQELVRRCIGRHQLRQTQTPVPGATSDKRKLTDWWHLRTPFIRMVSNAVPHEQASKLTSEWAAATEVYGEEMTNNTRFKHILFGGTGLHNEGNKTADLQHDFDMMYSVGSSPFSSTTATAQSTDFYSKPMPGIESVNTSYKGDKGALKKAQVKIKCYSLSDLERLEKLYMYPGIKVLLEWGWSVNTASTSGDFSNQPIPLVPLDDEILKNVGEVHRLIALNRRDSGGCVDGMMGTVINFSWQVNPTDLSFDCTLSLTDIGDSIFTSNINSPPINKETGDKEKEDDKGFTLTQALDDIENQIEAAGRKDANEIGNVTITFKNTLDAMDVTFFRLARGTVSKLSSDSSKTSKRRRCYIRFGDVVDQLLNRLYMISSTESQADSEEVKATAHAMFSIGGSLIDGKINVKTIKGINDNDKVSELPISVISNHEYLVSVDPDVCLLPGQIGASPYDVEAELGKRRFNTYAPSGLDADDNVKFNVTKDQAKDLADFGEESEGPDGFDESKKTAGLLANIFVNTDMLQEIATESMDVAQFLNGVTRKINSACGDIWMFNWTMTDEHPGVMTCIDRNFYWDGQTTAVELPVANLSGILKSYSCKSTINSQTANALFIASNSSKTGGDFEKSKLISKGLIPLEVDFTMDGISGIQMGTIFAVDYIPSRYRDLCYLYSWDVQHSISPSGWDTTVTSKFRFATKENGYKKIYLSKVPLEADISDVDSIISTVEEEVIGAGEGNGLETQNEEVQGIMPQSIIQSLEAQGVTIGAVTGDPGKGGVTNDEAKEKVETRDDLVERMNKTLSKIYHKGTGIDTNNVNNAFAILQKILFLPEK